MVPFVKLGISKNNNSDLELADRSYSLPTPGRKQVVEHEVYFSREG